MLFMSSYPIWDHKQLGANVENQAQWSDPGVVIKNQVRITPGGQIQRLGFVQAKSRPDPD